MKHLEREKIKKAIILIHHKGEYFEGLDILTELVGWTTVRNEFDGDQETNYEAIQKRRYKKGL